MNSKNSKTSDPPRLYSILQKNRLKEKWEVCCFIKSQHLIYMEKYKKVM